MSGLSSGAPEPNAIASTSLRVASTSALTSSSADTSRTTCSRRVASAICSGSGRFGATSGTPDSSARAARNSSSNSSPRLRITLGGNVGTDSSAAIDTGSRVASA